MALLRLSAGGGLMRSPGAIASAQLSAGTGGGGGGYVASAVTVDLETNLLNPSLIASGDDTGFLTYVYWFKMSASDFAARGVLWVQDPENYYPSNAYIGYNSGHATIHHQFCSSQDENCLNAVIGNGGEAGPTDVPQDIWTPLLVSVKTNLSPTSAMVLQAYFGDTEIINFTDKNTNNSLAPFLMTWNGLSMQVFNDGFGNPAPGSYADFWFAPGQFIDFSVEANRRKFVDASGKPVYLGANGELPTGTAPAVFFSGDADTFATNKGTGGAFTLTGTLTNATTSPSD